MLAISLAVLAAVSYGASDFCAGIGGRTRSLMPLMLTAQIASLCFSLICALFVGGNPTGQDLAWGAAGGIVGAFGLLALYWALAAGPMALAAPITAITAIAFPVAFGILVEHDPVSVLFMGGLVLGVIAILLLSVSAEAEQPSERPHPRPVSKDRLILIAAIAGLGIGSFSIALSKTSADAHLWPLVAARFASCLLFLPYFPVLWHLPGKGHAYGIGCGLFDGLGNLCYILAVHRDVLAVIAPIAAFYPASTMILAALIVKERVRFLQGIGLVSAGIAIGLIAVR